VCQARHVGDQWRIDSPFGPRGHYFKPLMRTMSLVSVDRVMATRLPSLDHAKNRISRRSAKRVAYARVTYRHARGPKAALQWASEHRHARFLHPGPAP
jgi:hypothetical protein